MNPGGARIVVVLGMHRSGTSLITRALEVLGVSLGDRLMPPADGNNAKGFFEDIDINALNIAALATVGCDWQSIRPLDAEDFDRLRREGWVDKALAVLQIKARQGHVFGFKDPRTARLLPLWQEVFAAGGFAVKYLLALRNPASVTDSLVNRDGMARERSYYLWLEHVLASLAGTAGCAPALVDYDDFFGDADRVLARMAAGLNLKVDAAERVAFKNEFIDDTLRHAVHSGEDLQRDPGCPPLVLEVYQALRAASRQGTAADLPQLRTSLARWTTEMQRMAPALRLADARPAIVVQAASEAAAVEILKVLAQHAPQLLHAVFDGRWYGQAYPDVAEAGIEPYSHYSETGVFEGRYPGPDVADAARRALDALAGGRDAPAAADLLAAVQRDTQRWADMMELQRSFREREQALGEQLQQLRNQLHQTQERRVEREAAWVAREREAVAAADEGTRRQCAELDAARRESAAREAAAVAARDLSEAALRDLRSQAAAAGREQAACIASLTREASEREARQQQALEAARVRTEEMVRRLAEQASAAQGREAALQAKHAEAVAGFEEAAAAARRELAQAQAEADGLRRRAAELESASRQREEELRAAHEEALARLGGECDSAAQERAVLASALDGARAELDAVHRSVLWRALAPVLGRRRQENT